MGFAKEVSDFILIESDKPGQGIRVEIKYITGTGYRDTWARTLVHGKIDLPKHFGFVLEKDSVFTLEEVGGATQLMISGPDPESVRSSMMQFYRHLLTVSDWYFQSNGTIRRKENLLNNE